MFEERDDKEVCGMPKTHYFPEDRVHYVWDNEQEPVLTVEPGDTVVYHTREVSDGQIGPDSTVDVLDGLDWDSLYPLAGALFSCGDAHAAQGDGEVCVTGIESPVYAALRFDLIKGRSIPAPQFQTPGPLTPLVDEAGWYATMGVNEDLMQAAKDSLRAMVEHISTTYGLEPVEAYVLASLVVDLKISEIVDQPNWIVSSYLPLAIFR
jgi:acetamidase/formamidase